jgi:hypothetical protein
LIPDRQTPNVLEGRLSDALNDWRSVHKAKSCSWLRVNPIRTEASECDPKSGSIVLRLDRRPTIVHEIAVILNQRRQSKEEQIINNSNPTH